MNDEEKLAVAARFAASSRAGGGEAYRALCAPGAVTWHNFDDVEVPTEQTVRTLQWLHRTVPDLAWHDVAVYPTPDRFRLPDDHDRHRARRCAASALVRRRDAR